MTRMTRHTVPVVWTPAQRQAADGERRCPIWAPYGKQGKRECGRAATVHVRSGCIHEHVWDGWICEGHAEHSEGKCGHCYTADGHVCVTFGNPAPEEAVA